jgi:hypothetical protein
MNTYHTQGIAMKQLPRTRRRSARLGRYALLLSLTLTTHAVAAGATSDAKNASSLVADVVKQTGRTGGLVVLLDNGDTALADAFSNRPQFLLQTLLLIVAEMNEELRIGVHPSDETIHVISVGETLIYFLAV